MKHEMDGMKITWWQDIKAIWFTLKTFWMFHRLPVSISNRKRGYHDDEWEPIVIDLMATADWIRSKKIGPKTEVRRVQELKRHLGL